MSFIHTSKTSRCHIFNRCVNAEHCSGLKTAFCISPCSYSLCSKSSASGQCMGIKYACNKWYFFDAHSPLHLLKSLFLWNLWCYIQQVTHELCHWYRPSMAISSTASCIYCILIIVGPLWIISIIKGHHSLRLYFMYVYNNANNKPLIKDHPSFKTGLCRDVWLHVSNDPCYARVNLYNKYVL
jgi:hypothetical protein